MVAHGNVGGSLLVSHEAQDALLQKISFISDTRDIKEENKLSFKEVLYCVDIIKSAREKQDENVVKELLLKHIDGYTSEVA